jgi:hypothetical protein
MELFRRSLGIHNKVFRHARGGETLKRYYGLTFGDIYFYKFLTRIGLTPAKSKTLQAVEIPKRFFADFLRGLFDGDGSFYTYWDRRWKRSFVFQMTFCSASKSFIHWLQNKLNELYDVKGVLRRGDGDYVIRYVKGDSIRLYNHMYRPPTDLFLSRKYNKIRSAIEFDRELHDSR